MRITTFHQQPLTRRERRDLRVLGRFTDLYCRHHHGGETRKPFALEDLDPRVIFGRRLPRLCPACSVMLSHGIVKRLRCPMDPKPMCKECACPCYGAAHRARVREVMRFSGPRMILRGRLDYLWHMR
jgi:hypothetical protein